VPLYALNQVSAERADWLVPGMLKEKVHLLLKSLPQKLRRHCVPLPDYAAAFHDRIQERVAFGKGNLLDALIADVREQTSIVTKITDFKLETLPAHHFMNFKIVDEHGRQLDMGRNLASLQAEFGGQARESFQKLADKTTAMPAESQVDAQRTVAQQGARTPASSDTGVAASSPAQHDHLTSWTFGELPELLEIQRGKQTLIGYPALVDKGTYCDLEVFDDPAEAARTHRAGLRRLFALQLKEQLKYLEKNIPGLQQMGMQFMALGSQEELREQILQVALDRAFMQEPLPKNAEEFNARKDEGKSRIGLLVNEIARLIGQILAEYYALPKKLQGIKAHAQAAADIQSQLQALIGKRFVAGTDYLQLTHFPRYLKAINIRLEKLRADATRDTRLMAEWAQVATLWQRAQKDRHVGKHHDPRMVEFRWLLEELRVSLFAQELRTPMPVSAKRLQKVWESMQR
jgi:ATP-dependent helicase HrpA